MDASQQQVDLTQSSQFGGTFLEIYVTQPLQKEIQNVYDTLDNAIQNALDKIVDESGGISYQPKSISEISQTKPNQGNVFMNYQIIKQLADGDEPTDAINKRQFDARVNPEIAINRNPNNGSVDWITTGISTTAGAVAGGVFGVIGGTFSQAIGSGISGLFSAIGSAVGSAAGGIASGVAQGISIGNNLIDSATKSVKQWGANSTYGNDAFYDGMAEGFDDMTQTAQDSLSDLNANPNETNAYKFAAGKDSGLQFKTMDGVDYNLNQQVDPGDFEEYLDKAYEYGQEKDLGIKNAKGDALPGSQMNMGRLASTGQIQAPSIQSTAKLEWSDFNRMVQKNPETGQYGYVGAQVDEWGFMVPGSSYWVYDI